MRIFGLAAAALMACVAVAPLHGVDPSPADVALSLQRKYDGVRDFSADFVHHYKGGVLRKELTERGRLLVKKPGKFRWEYAAPDQKVFVSDGLKLYSYLPQDKQVIVANIPQDDTATAPTLFLAGKGNIVRDFKASAGDLPPGSPAGARALKLVPNTPQPDYDWLVLVIDSQTLSLRGLVSTDSQGGTSSFSFANLKENVGLTDKTFAFQIPRGVDVVTESAQR